MSDLLKGNRPTCFLHRLWESVHEKKSVSLLENSTCTTKNFLSDFFKSCRRQPTSDLSALTSSCCPVRAAKHQDDLCDNSLDFFTPEIHGDRTGCCRKRGLPPPYYYSSFLHALTLPGRCSAPSLPRPSAQHPPDSTAMTRRRREATFWFGCTLQSEVKEEREGEGGTKGGWRRERERERALTTVTAPVKATLVIKRT